MKYHWNDASFTNKSPILNFKIVSTGWRVTGVSVTSGQDPDGNVKVGQTVKDRRDGKISFRLGRKGSEATANWFKDSSRAPSSKNTFNKNPDKLNFAVELDLELGIVWPELTGETEVVVKFPKIVVAQGHAGTANNWWFGGNRCSYKALNSVTCPGSITVLGQTIALTAVFLRGTFGIANGVDDIWLMHLQPELKGLKEELQQSIKDNEAALEKQLAAMADAAQAENTVK